MEETPRQVKPKKRSQTDEGQKPAHVITVGSLVASIHIRQAPSGYAYFAYNVKRSYRSLSTGNQIFSTDFFAENESDLLAVVNQASRWIAAETQRNREPAKDAVFHGPSRRARPLFTSDPALAP
jgi:hypothetical protein